MEKSFPLFYKSLLQQEQKTFAATGSLNTLKTIHFFERKGNPTNYTVHGPDALFVAQEYYKTLTVVKYPSTTDSSPEKSLRGKRSRDGQISNQLATVSITPTMFKIILRDLFLIKKQYRVSLYGTGDDRTWSLKIAGSPGNSQQFESLLFDENGNDSVSQTASTILLALDINPITFFISAAFCDPTLGHLMYSEFQDNHRFSNLESLIAQSGSSEIIISTENQTNLFQGDSMKDLSAFQNDQDSEEFNNAITRLSPLKYKKSSTGDSSVSVEQNSILENPFSVIGEILDRSQVAITSLESSYFKKTNKKKLLIQLAELLGLEEENATSNPLLFSLSSSPNNRPLFSVLNALCTYLGLFEPFQKSDNEYNSTKTKSMYSLQEFNLNSFVKLDPAAFRALSLFPTPESNSFNLFEMLNETHTRMGKRLLETWIKQPLVSPKDISKRYDMVQFFLSNGTVLDALTLHLKHLPDIDRVTFRFQKKKGSLKDCVSLYQAAIRIPLITTCLAQATCPPELKSTLSSFTQQLETLGKQFLRYEALIEKTIDLGSIAQHKYLIAPNFNPKLKQLAQEKQNCLNKIKKSVFAVADDLSVSTKQLHLETNSVLGWYYRASRADEKLLRKNKRFSKGYTVLETHKDGIRFHNTHLDSLNHEYSHLYDTYQQEQNQIVRVVCSIAYSYLHAVQKLGSLIGQLDTLSSFAIASRNAPIPFVRPNIFPIGSPQGIILEKSRHPILERQSTLESFIPNSVSLVPNKSQFCIISGCNMGGKSTYIRQIGLIVLMAQIGCFVPCSRADITCVDAILARIGAGDDQLLGLSTFMAEMVETSTILSTVTPNSLVIIDELGRGTSTYDGFGLAWALSEFLSQQVSSYCLFATHFHELTTLAYNYSNVVNKHVTAIEKDGRLVFLFQVKDGPSDESFGIHVARMVGFPSQVVEAAQEKSKQLEFFFEKTDSQDEKSKMDLRPDDLNENSDSPYTTNLNSQNVSKITMETNSKDGNHIIPDNQEMVDFLKKFFQTDLTNPQNISNLISSQQGIFE